AAIDSLMPYRLEATYQDVDGRLHIAPRGLGYYTVSNEGKVNRVMGVDSGVHGFVITRLADGTPFHFSVMNRDKYAAKVNLRVYYWDQQQAPKALVELKTNRPYFHSSLAQLTDGSLTLSTGTEDLVTIRSDTLVDYHRLSHKVFHLFADKDTNLWIGTYRGGILRVKDQDYAQAERLLPGHVGAAVAQDQNGGIWCQSSAAIFHYIPDWRIKQFAVTEASTAQEQATSITEGNGAVYCSYDEGKLLVVAADSLRTVVIPERFVDRDLPKISYDPVRDWVWLSFAHTALAYDGDSWIPFVIPDSVVARMGKLTDLLVLNDSVVLGLTKKGLLHVHPESPMQVYPSRKKTYAFQCFTQDDAGRVWIGSERGIWAWDGESYQQPIPEDTSSKAPSGNVIQIGFSAGRLWINTLKNGLFVYKQNALHPILDNAGKHVYISDFSLEGERC
ncbi:MAG: two-component regulator propeller domain-containing protein, partial [Bacteroidota bacterium]